MSCQLVNVHHIFTLYRSQDVPPCIAHLCVTRCFISLPASVFWVSGGSATSICPSMLPSSHCWSTALSLPCIISCWPFLVDVLCQFCSPFSEAVLIVVHAVVLHVAYLRGVSWWFLWKWIDPLKWKNFMMVKWLVHLHVHCLWLVPLPRACPDCRYRVRVWIRWYRKLKPITTVCLLDNWQQ